MRDEKILNRNKRESNRDAFIEVITLQYKTPESKSELSGPHNKYLRGKILPK